MHNVESNTMIDSTNQTLDYSLQYMSLAIVQERNKSISLYATQ